MERRAASHTEEEEMNTRRRLLNAARRGDAKAINKLFELYQVRVLSGDQLAKVNKTSTYMVPVKPAKSGKGGPKGGGKVSKPSHAHSPKAQANPAKSSGRKSVKLKAKHK